MLLRLMRYAAAAFVLCCMCAPAYANVHPTANLTITGSFPTGGAAGVVFISFDGFTESVSYGPFSTTASIASALAAKFSQDPIANLPVLCSRGLCAKANGAVITFELSAGSFGPVVVSSPTLPFQVSTASWPSATPLATPSMTVDCSPNPAVQGTAIACSAVAMPGDATGSVTFSLNGEPPWATAAVSAGSATASTISSLSSGDYTIVAEYSGDTKYESVEDELILSVTQTALTSTQLYSFDMTATGALASNGNIIAYNDIVNGNWSNMTYDSLNRLIGGQVQPAGGAATQYFCWTYDAFGNRTTQQISAATFQSSTSNCQATSGTPVGNFLAYNAQNQLSNSTIQYDGDGNMTYDGTNYYLYDAEDRLCATVTFPFSGGRWLTEYIYDASGQRVAKGQASLAPTDVPSCNASGLASFALSSAYILGPNGVITETDGNGGWIHTNVAAAGQLIATYANDGVGVHFHLSDWLGTRRVQANSLGMQERTFTNMPFGEAPNSSGDVTEEHFTGKERDTESGLDYFGVRYYGSNMGRFMSPDPSGLAYADLSDPQSLNLYVYVRNNPLINIDPTGLDCVHINNNSGAIEGFERGDCDNSTEALANTGHYIDDTVNQIAFNGQAQVIGYEGSKSDGIFDSPGASNTTAGVAYWNPGTGALTAAGQSATVTANPYTIEAITNPWPNVSQAALRQLTYPVAKAYHPPLPTVRAYQAPPPFPSPSTFSCLTAPDAAADIHNIRKGVLYSPGNDTDGVNGIGVPQLYAGGNLKAGGPLNENYVGNASANAAALAADSFKSSVGCFNSH